jgi:hypothetical protein
LTTLLDVIESLGWEILAWGLLNVLKIGTCSKNVEGSVEVEMKVEHEWEAGRQLSGSSRKA